MIDEIKKLDELACKWRTDKSDFIGSNGHGYAKKYEEIFNKWRLNYINLLEIGVATGASIGMWYEYFENGKIFCFDDVDRSNESVLSELLKTNRVFFEIGNQENKNDLINILQKFNINNSVARFVYSIIRNIDDFIEYIGPLYFSLRFSHHS